MQITKMQKVQIAENHSVDEFIINGLKFKITKIENGSEGTLIEAYTIEVDTGKSISYMTIVDASDCTYWGCGDVGETL